MLKTKLLSGRATFSAPLYYEGKVAMKKVISVLALALSAALGSAAQASVAEYYRVRWKTSGTFMPMGIICISTEAGPESVSMTSQSIKWATLSN
jgi:hypothetical protein